MSLDHKIDELRNELSYDAEKWGKAFIQKTSENLTTSSHIEWSYGCINADDGTCQSDADETWKHTPGYISAEAGYEIRIIGSVVDMDDVAMIAFYDANKVYLSSLTVTLCAGYITHAVPENENIAFVRFSLANTESFGSQEIYIVATAPVSTPKDNIDNIYGRLEEMDDEPSNGGGAVFKYLMSNGVLNGNDPDALLTTAVGGLVVKTNAGAVLIDGELTEYASETRTFLSPSEDKSYVRIVRLDRNTNTIATLWRDVVFQGDLVISPEDMALLPIRDNSCYDLVTCLVEIPAGATEITADMIRDLRSDVKYCGFVDMNVGGGTVKSVNGKTGAVELDAEDVGAADKQKVEQISKQVADNEDSITALEKAFDSLKSIVVESVEEMTDTSKQYVLKSTGTVWKYEEVTTEQVIDVTDQIVGTEDNPYQVGRISSSGGITTDVTTTVVSPYIDICKDEYVGKTIKIHFEGLQYVTESEVSYVQHSLFGTDKTTVIQARSSTTPNTSVSALPAIAGVNITIISDTSAVVEIPIPAMFNGSQVGYIRFSANGDEANSNIYITYQVTKTVTGGAWVDTGVSIGDDGVDRAIVAGLNNEGADPNTVTLLPSVVKEFYNSAAYPDDDYSFTNITTATYPYRADVPVPYTVKWNYNENAMRTVVAVDDSKPIDALNWLTMRTYDATGLNKYPLYNLMPNKTYYYRVTHVMSDGSILVAKSGSFTTSAETWRLIYIDGTQNVRDFGGWKGLDGKKVKYGMLFRGAALSDSSFPELIVTGKGRRALGDLGVRAELNLGAVDTETSIAANCEYTKIGYSNYATAFNDATAKANFKIALEWIVGRLNASKPIYMHCQGGCDRTGTLSFQLLGLLGVSESDLARDYELSSFSDVGFGRLRTTTYEVNTYDYVGMVEAIKAYSGDTITDKFYNFAIDCVVSTDTITAFRNLMLT